MALSKEASQIGSLVRTAREEAGLTQEQVAGRVGVSASSTYPRWERGEQRIPRAAFLALAAILGKPLSYFGKEAERLGEKVPRGTSPGKAGHRPITPEALRRLRIIQNDLERELLDLEVPDEVLEETGRMFAEMTRTVRALLAGEPVRGAPSLPDRMAMTGAPAGPPGRSMDELPGYADDSGTGNEKAAPHRTAKGTSGGRRKRGNG